MIFLFFLKSWFPLNSIFKQIPNTVYTNCFQQRKHFFVFLHYFFLHINIHSEALYRSALDSDPLYIDALLGLAELLWHSRNELEAAEQLYKRAALIAESTNVGQAAKKSKGGSEISSASVSSRNSKSSVLSSRGSSSSGPAPRGSRILVATGKFQ